MLIEEWTIRGCKVERRKENNFLILIGNTFKKNVKSFREAFMFACGPEAEAKIAEVESRAQEKKVKAKMK